MTDTDDLTKPYEPTLLYFKDSDCFEFVLADQVCVYEQVAPGIDFISPMDQRNAVMGFKIDGALIRQAAAPSPAPAVGELELCKQLQSQFLQAFIDAGVIKNEPGGGTTGSVVTLAWLAAKVAAARIEQLEAMLQELVYEITHLSPNMEDDKYRSIIAKTVVDRARALVKGRS